MLSFLWHKLHILFSFACLHLTNVGSLEQVVSKTRGCIEAYPINFVTKFQFLLIKEFSHNPEPSVVVGINALCPEMAFHSFVTRFSFVPLVSPQDVCFFLKGLIPKLSCFSVFVDC